MGAELLQLRQHRLRKLTQRAVMVDANDGAEKVTVLLSDQLLGRGSRQLGLKLQDLLLIDVSHLELLGPHLVALLLAGSQRHKL